MGEIETQVIKPHSFMAKLLHWGFIGIFAYAIFKQLDNVAQLADPGLLIFEMVFAAVFLALLVFRFFFMRITPPTALPETTPKPIKFLARSGHLAIYFSLGMIAISGLAIGTLYALGITSGTLMAIALGAHEISVTASYITIILHIAAALVHRFKGDGIWSTMVPLFKEKQKSA